MLRWYRKSLSVLARHTERGSGISNGTQGKDPPR